ncbi:MAG TPA: redox-sensing transcriptional repressor Rex [Candidatus Cloacimonadota bacterium]|nr:redox-sensing transcriptional repressor Rex [Candidatus Cloacimonadota bacterium]
MYRIHDAKKEIKVISVPVLTLKRLPQYLELLYKFQRDGLAQISATRLAEITGVHMTQVRKDLALTGVVGVPKIGHKTSDLIQAIEEFLNWNDNTSCFLVGAGRLGTALLGYQELTKKGLSILVAFDTNPDLIGTVQNGTRIYGLDRFANLSKRLHVRIGILTVPAEVAQTTAEMMIQNGIVAIWNFTPVHLNLPPDIIVEEVDMSASLAVLSRRLAEKLHHESSVERSL